MSGDWDSFASTKLREQAVGNVVSGAQVTPDAAVGAIKAAPQSGVPAAVAMHAPAESNDMALFHDHTAILNDSPEVASFAASDPAKAAATKDDFQNFAGVAVHTQNWAQTTAIDFFNPGVSAARQLFTDVKRYHDAAGQNKFSPLDLIPGFSPSDKKLGSILADVAGVAFTLPSGAANVAARYLAFPQYKTNGFGQAIMQDGHFVRATKEEAQSQTAGALLTATMGLGPKGYEGFRPPPVVDEGTFSSRTPLLPGPTEHVPDAEFTDISPPGVSPRDTDTYHAVAELDAEHARRTQLALTHTKTLTRAPELAEDFIENHTDLGGQTVSVPAESITALWDEGHDLFSDKQTEIMDALHTGGEVQIPLSTYLTQTAGKPFAEDLLNVTRFRQNGVTLDEAKDLPQPQELIEQGAQPTFDLGQYEMPVSEGQGQLFMAKPNSLDPKIIEDMLPTAEQFGGRYAPGRANTAFAFRTEEGRQAFLDEIGNKAKADLSPAFEEIQGKPGVNVRRMAGMLGPQLYGDPEVTAPVTAKEVLQNSFDAIKGMLNEGKLEKGNINITLNQYGEDGRTITFHDNGSGMAPNLLGGKFLQIAGSEKGENASGGFGIAKMLFLYGNNKLHVTTMKDGVVSEMLTSGPELMNALDEDGTPPTIQVRRGADVTEADRAMFPEGHGTHISLQIPESYTDQKTGQSQPIPFPYDETDIPALTNSPLFANVDVNFRRSPHDDFKKLEGIGSGFNPANYTTFANVKFPWGTARIYIAKEPSEGRSWNPQTHVLSNGLWQFSEKLPADPMDMYGKQLPYKIYVDVSPNVKPDQPGYPFGFNRQAFTESAQKDMAQIKKYIQAMYGAKTLANEAASFGQVTYLGMAGPYSAPVDISPEVPQSGNAFDRFQEGDNVEVRDGKLIVNGQELPELTPEELKAAVPKSDELKVDQRLIDPHRVMIHDNVELLVKDKEDDVTGTEIPFTAAMHNEFGARWMEFERTVGQGFLELRDQVARIMGYDKLAEEAVGLSYDKTYRGVSIRVPFNGSFINPVATESADPVEAAYGMIGTMIHELAHFKVRSHNASFPAEMQKITYKISADKTFDFHEWQRNLVNDILMFEDVFKKGNEVFNGSDTSNDQRSFGDGSAEPRSDEGGAGDAEGLAPALQGTEGGRGLPGAARDGDTAGGSGGGGAGVRPEPQVGGNAGADTVGTFVGDIQRAAGTAVKAAKEIEGELGLRRIFEDGKAAGMTQGQFKSYSDALAKWEKEAEEKIVKKMIAQWHREHTPDWKAAVELHTEDAAKQINSQTAVKAMRALRDPMFKLDKAEVAEKFPEVADRLPNTVVKAGGMSPDEAAELNGYESGAALVEAIAHLQTAIESSGAASLDGYIKLRAKVYATEQARQMVGYDMSPKAILDEVRASIDSPTLEDALTGTVRDFATENGLPFDKDAVKAMAEQAFGNLTVHAASRPKAFGEEMRRLGNKAEKYLLDKKPFKALEAKVQQLIQYHHMRHSFGFQKELARATKALNQVAKKPISQGMDQTARNHLRWIAREVGFNVKTDKYEGVDAALQGQSLEAYINSLRNRGLDPVFAEIPRMSLNDMTVEQMRGVAATVKSLSQLGRWEKKAFLEGKQAWLADLVQEIKDNATSIGRPFTAGQLHKDAGKLPDILGYPRRVGAAVARPETFLFWLDKETNGPLMRYIVSELQNGKYYKTDKINEIGKSFREFVKEQPKGWQHSLDDAVDVPELLYSRGADGQPIKWLQRRGDVIMMATHFGTDSNFQKLTEGFGWDQKTVRDVANRVLTEADWKYVQFILDVNKGLLPEVKALYRATVGLALEELVPTPIETPYGTLPGGYRHISYDWNSIEEREGPDGESVTQEDPTSLHMSDLFGPEYRIATPPNSYTLKRTNFSAPLSLEHSILHREIESVIHDLAYRKALIQATKIFRQGGVRQAVREALGPEYMNAINGWLKDIARGASYDQTVLKGGAALIRGLRRRFTMVQIGYNVATILKHGGIAASHISGEVGIPEFAKASSDLMKDKELQQWVDEQSGEVRGALMNLDRDVREILQDIFRKQGFIEAYKYHAFTAFGAVKRIEAMATWLAKYRTLTGDGMAHEDAVALANKAVRDTQGAGSPVDLPGLWRGDASFWAEVGKLSNIFTGFENTATNRAWTMIRRGGGGGGKGPPGGDDVSGWQDRGPAGGRRDFGKQFSDLLSYFLIPALWATAFDTVTQGKLHKGAKNGAVFLEHYLENSLKGLLGGSVPMGNLLAELPRAIASRGKDFGGAGPLQEMFGSTVGTAVDLYDLAVGHPHKVEDRWVQHAIETAGYVLGLPVKPLSKAGQFIWDRSQGHVKDKSMVEFFRGLVFGPSSEEAKKPR